MLSVSYGVNEVRGCAIKGLEGFTVEDIKNWANDQYEVCVNELKETEAYRIISDLLDKSSWTKEDVVEAKKAIDDICDIGYGCKYLDKYKEMIKDCHMYDSYAKPIREMLDYNNEYSIYRMINSRFLRRLVEGYISAKSFKVIEEVETRPSMNDDKEMQETSMIQEVKVEDQLPTVEEESSTEENINNPEEETKMVISTMKEAVKLTGEDFARMGKRESDLMAQYISTEVLDRVTEADWEEASSKLYEVLELGCEYSRYPDVFVDAIIEFEKEAIDLQDDLEFEALREATLFLPVEKEPVEEDQTETRPSMNDDKEMQETSMIQEVKEESLPSVKEESLTQENIYVPEEELTMVYTLSAVQNLDNYDFMKFTEEEARKLVNDLIEESMRNINKNNYEDMQKEIESQFMRASLYAATEAVFNVFRNAVVKLAVSFVDWEEENVDEETSAVEEVKETTETSMIHTVEMVEETPSNTFDESTMTDDVVKEYDKEQERIEWKQAIEGTYVNILETTDRRVSDKEFAEWFASKLPKQEMKTISCLEAIDGEDHVQKEPELDSEKESEVSPLARIFMNQMERERRNK